VKANPWKEFRAELLRAMKEAPALYFMPVTLAWAWIRAGATLEAARAMKEAASAIQKQ
jgi:hypothetical protein